MTYSLWKKSLKQGVILETYQTAVTVWIVLIQFNELFNRLKLNIDYKESRRCI